ncbi:ribosome modulation factor [Lichenifustis flavocetrariae]|uniref:ribosome modulation factor n=1 Tax=Lichenifustis flavocetrariae TaxID=2949735 RepID=UPI003D0B1CB9
MASAAFQEGVVAAKSNRTRNDNPYASSTEAGSEWLRGYEAVMKVLGELDDGDHGQWGSADRSSGKISGF